MRVDAKLSRRTKGTRDQRVGEKEDRGRCGVNVLEAPCILTKMSL